MAYLEALTAQGRRLVPLDGSRVSIGRGPECQITIEDDRAVSRLHALLESLDAGWCLRDLQSRNGTFVNGDRITGLVALRRGDEIQIGDWRLRYCDEDNDVESTLRRESPADALLLSDAPRLSEREGRVACARTRRDRRPDRPRAVHRDLHRAVTPRSDPRQDRLSQEARAHTSRHRTGDHPSRSQHPADPVGRRQQSDERIDRLPRRRPDGLDRLDRGEPPKSFGFDRIFARAGTAAFAFGPYLEPPRPRRAGRGRFASPSRAIHSGSVLPSCFAAASRKAGGLVAGGGSFDAGIGPARGVASVGVAGGGPPAVSGSSAVPAARQGRARRVPPRADRRPPGSHTPGRTAYQPQNEK